MEKSEYSDMFSKLHTSIDEREIIINRKRSGRPRTAAILLAAVLVFALAVSAAAIYRGRLQDLMLRSGEMSTPELSNGNAEAPGGTQRSATYDPLKEGTDMISLQGYAGSPEYQAVLEWAEFQHGYDRDGEELEKVGNVPTEWDEKYGANGYLIYTQEMAEKLDEIAARYGLSLHYGGIHDASLNDLKSVFGDFIQADKWGGYYYEDGTFQSDCIFDGADFQLRRCMKGTLDTVPLNIGDAEQYEQWEYETACGETVLLALGPSKALIFADLDKSFIAVNVMAGTDGNFTAQRLEALANAIDFSTL
jgi:hypothetical protein